MIKPYAEFLKENGATDDDVKLLDTPVARKVYEAQAKAAEKATADHAAAQTRLTEYDKWYSEVAEPTAARALQERDVALAEAASERARLKSLQDSGLIKVAAATEPPKVDPNAPPAVDLSKYVDRDTLARVADAEGDAIAAMQDIADEHRELFGTRINAKELRAKAKEQKKSLEQVWLDTYSVPTKRAEKAAADKSAHEKKIADEAVAKYRSESENPLTRTPVASNNPTFNKRSATGELLPWQSPSASSDRVNKALQNLQQKNVI